MNMWDIYKTLDIFLGERRCPIHMGHCGTLGTSPLGNMSHKAPLPPLGGGTMGHFPAPLTKNNRRVIT